MDRHPIQDNPPLSLERRIHLLEIYLGRLWDQVWWMSLSVEERAEWEAQGYTAPIQQFYGGQ
jgi:hypothetical protein